MLRGRGQASPPAGGSSRSQAELRIVLGGDWNLRIETHSPGILIVPQISKPVRGFQ